MPEFGLCIMRMTYRCHSSRFINVLMGRAMVWHFEHLVVPGHDREASLDIVIQLGAIPVRNEVGDWGARLVLPVVVAPQIPAQNVQFVEEQVVAEDAIAANGGAVC